MKSLIVALLFAAAAVINASSAGAQNAKEDCEQSSDDLKKLRACTELLRRNPRDVKVLRQRANAFSFLDLTDKAIAEISKIIDIEPRNAEPYSRRGEWYADEGDYEKAIADFDRSLALEFDPLTLQRRAYAHLGKGDYARAQADATQMISADRTKPFGYTIRGRALLAMKSYKEAIADFQRAIQLDPQDSELEKAMIKAAEAESARASGQPFPPELARTLCKQSYVSRVAIDACTSLIDGGSGDTYLYLFQRGLAYQDSGDQPRAIADFAAAIERNANGVPAYYQRANSNQKLGNLDAAIDDLTHVLKQHPDEGDFLALRADLYRRKGDHQRALADYEALARKSDWRDTATIRIEDAKAAIAAMPRQTPAASPSPAPPEAKSAPGKEQVAANRAAVPPSSPALGDCSHASQPDLAIIACGTLLQQNPQNAEALVVRAAAYHDKKAYDRAIADYTAAIKLQPKNPILYNERGYAQFESGELDLAVSDFSRAIETRPDYVRAHLNRGIVYARMRAYQLSLIDFRRVAELDPASTQIVQDQITGVNASIARANTGDDAEADYAACIREGTLGSVAKYTYPASIEVCSRAIESRKFTGGQLAKLYERRGYAHSLTNQTAKAVSDWDRLFELNPGADLDIVLSRARNRMEVGDRAGAIKDFQLYLEKTARIPEANRSMFYESNRACAIFELQQMKVPTAQKAKEEPNALCLMAMIKRR